MPSWMQIFKHHHVTWSKFGAHPKGRFSFFFLDVFFCCCVQRYKLQYFLLFSACCLFFETFHSFIRMFEDEMLHVRCSASLEIQALWKMLFWDVSLSKGKCPQATSRGVNGEVFVKKTCPCHCSEITPNYTTKTIHRVYGAQRLSWV